MINFAELQRLRLHFSEDLLEGAEYLFVSNQDAKDVANWQHLLLTYRKSELTSVMLPDDWRTAFAADEY